jgi:serine O-acetyltransferase
VIDDYPGLASKILDASRSARALFHRVLLRVSSEKGMIGKDVDRWLDALKGTRQIRTGPGSELVYLISRYPEFRNVFYYRIAKERRLRIKVLLELAKLFYKPIETLYIMTPSIGPGFFVQHGFSTVIAARSIGENFWVNQQVTIGFSSIDDCPTIGNNVAVKAGAIVIGAISIGDNSVVGAGAVVVKDVPPNCTVVGVPAYIVKRDGVKTKEPRGL